MVALAVVGSWFQLTGRGVVTGADGRQVDIGALMVHSSLIYLCSFVHVVPHELGHAIVGRCVGFRVLRITVGVGSPVVDARVGSTQIDVRALPVGGLTVGTTSVRRALRLRLWLFAAGGPAVTIAVTVVAWRLAQGIGPGWLGSVLSAFVFAGVVTAVGNLVPFCSRGLSSDGWKLLTTPFVSSASLDLLVRQSDVAEIAERSRRGDHDDAVVRAREQAARHPDVQERQLALVAVLIRAERWGEAAETMRHQLATLDLDDDHRVLHLNNLAWSDLMLGDPALLPEADRASAEAYAAQSWRHAIRGTRGAALVELGQLAEGIDLLRSSELRSHRPKNRAPTEAYLAIAHARGGNLWDARRRLASARDAAPTNPLVLRAAAEVAAAEVAAAEVAPAAPTNEATSDAEADRRSLT